MKEIKKKKNNMNEQNKIIENKMKNEGKKSKWKERDVKRIDGLEVKTKRK